MFIYFIPTFLGSLNYRNYHVGEQAKYIDIKMFVVPKYIQNSIYTKIFMEHLQEQKLHNPDARLCGGVTQALAHSHCGALRSHEKSKVDVLAGGGASERPGGESEF